MRKRQYANYIRNCRLRCEKIHFLKMDTSSTCTSSCICAVFDLALVLMFVLVLSLERVLVLVIRTFPTTVRIIYQTRMPIERLFMLIERLLTPTQRFLRPTNRATFESYHRLELGLHSEWRLNATQWGSTHKTRNTCRTPSDATTTV